MSDDLIIVSEPAKRIFTITADNRLIWHEPMPVADPGVILAATDVVASQYGLVRRERLEAAEAKLAKAVEMGNVMASFIRSHYIVSVAADWEDMVAELEEKDE
jgi:hypothetical protein